MSPRLTFQPTPMNTAPESPESLIAAYLDGSIHPEALERLNDLLIADAHFRAAFLETAQLHAELTTGLNESLFAESPPAPSPQPVATPAPATTYTPPRPAARQSLAPWLAAAAVVALVGVIAWWPLRPAASPDITASETPSGSSVAIVIAATNARWINDARPFDVGAAVRPGLFELHSGSVTLGFDSGVRLALEAPAALRIVSDMQVDLIHGRLAAQVPPSGRGFEVNTQSMEVIDLGTNFAVTAWKDGRSAVHVYKGVVDARHQSGGPFENLTTSMTREGSTQSQALNKVEFAAGEFTRVAAPTSARLLTTGRVRALDRPPSTLRQGTYQHEFLLAFAEGMPVSLKHPLSVVSPTSGEFVLNQQLTAMGRETLPAGTLITSWFLNLDVSGDRHQAAVGTLRFPDPIVGLLATRKDIDDSTPVLGSATTDYGSGREKVGLLEDDHIRISADRRTLTVKWSAARFADSLRVLTAPSNP